MKKILFLSCLCVAGLISAKNAVEPKAKNKVKAKAKMVVTIKTTCGTTHQVEYDNQINNAQYLTTKWQMYNQSDCGNAKYNIPVI